MLPLKWSVGRRVRANKRGHVCSFSLEGKVTRINRYGGLISGQVYTVRDQNSVLGSRSVYEMGLGELASFYAGLLI